MNKFISALFLASSLPFLFAHSVSAIDAPHNTLDCTDCHSIQNTPGPSLTAFDSDANLCMSCHNDAGLASAKPFNNAMLAVPGVSGTSHGWNAAMPGTSDPNNAFGLRATADLADADLRRRLEKFSDTATCSVCHDPHSQQWTPWDPFASAVPGESGRHFMRMDNDLNELCEDCHYYRTAASGRTDVRTYDGNKKSHPVVKIFSNANGETRDVADTSQFNTAPLEPASASWAAQTGSRYHLNGGSDTNTSNNIVLDSGARVRCLSCHGIHYTDSNASTVDGP